MKVLDLIKDEYANFEGTIGVALKNLRTGQISSINGDLIFPTASTRKTGIILCLYRKAELGLIDLNEKIIIQEKDKHSVGSGILKDLEAGLQIPIRDLAKLMMILSDGTATNLLVKKIGKKYIDSTPEKLGLTKTKFLSTRGKDTTTPKEMLSLLEMILEGKAVSMNSCKEIIEIMNKCQTGQFRIVKYLPMEKLQVAHKTGSRPPERGGIRNDVGIITLPDTNIQYILTCFTKDAKNDIELYQAEEIIAQISKKVYDNNAII